MSMVWVPGLLRIPVSIATELPKSLNTGTREWPRPQVARCIVEFSVSCQGQARHSRYEDRHPSLESADARGNTSDRRNTVGTVPDRVPRLEDRSRRVLRPYGQLCGRCALHLRSLP